MADTVLINGKRLKALREKHALSQEGLEHACSQKKGCSVSIATIKRAELGNKLSKRTVGRLATFFSVPIEELLSTTLADSEIEKEPCVEKMALALWVRADSKIIINEILDHISLLSPLITERFGNTLVAAVPCIYDGKKLYLTIQQILLNLSHRVTPYFRAIISTQGLSLQTDNIWYFNEAYIHEMSELALQLESATVLVSDELIEASLQCFSYADQAVVEGYKALLKRSDAYFGKTQGRTHEIELFHYAIDKVERINEHCLLTLQGVQGIGKSHLLNVLSDMADQRRWKTVRVDFQLASSPSESLLTALQELRSGTAIDTSMQESNEHDSSIRKEPEQRRQRDNDPVCLLMDNFHLIDEHTLANLLQFIAMSANETLLIGAAFLPTRTANHHVEAFSSVRLPMINMTLTPLLHQEMEKLFLEGFNVTTEVMNSVIERAQGNPAHFYQLLTSYSQNKIPNEVTLDLESKVDEFPSEWQRVMSLISFWDGNVTSADIYAVSNPPPGVIEALLEKKLISLSSEKGIHLNHPFLNDVIQRRASHREKRAINLTIADYLASGDSSPCQETQRQLIGYYTKAEEWQKAAQLSLSFGRRCIESGDYNSAKHDLNTALENYQRLPNPEQWLELLFDIYLAQATVARTTKGWVSHSTVVAYQRCIELAKKLSCTFRHCISLSGLWVRQLMAMDFKLSEETANEMLSLAEQSNDTRCKSLAYSCLTNSQFWLAKHQAAICHAKASFDCYQKNVNKDFYTSIGINPIALAGCFGRLSATLCCCDEDIRFFQRFQSNISLENEPFSYAIVLQGEIWSAYHLKEFQQVITLSEQLLAIAAANDFPFYTGIASLFKGWALFFTAPSDQETSLTLFEEGYQHWLASSGDQIAHSLYSLMKAELYCEVGRSEEAQDILQDGIAVALEKNEACYLSPMYALLGRLVDDDIELIKRSHEIAHEQGARLFLNQ